MTWHPMISIAKACKNDNSNIATNTSKHEKIANRYSQSQVMFLLWVPTSSIKNHQSKRDNETYEAHCEKKLRRNHKILNNCNHYEILYVSIEQFFY